MLEPCWHWTVSAAWRLHSPALLFSVRVPPMLVMTSKSWVRKNWMLSVASSLSRISISLVAASKSTVAPSARARQQRETQQGDGEDANGRGHGCASSSIRARGASG